MVRYGSRITGPERSGGLRPRTNGRILRPGGTESYGAARRSAYSLFPRRQFHDELRVARFGGEGDGASELTYDDAVGDIEAKARANTGGLGGEEGLENLIAILGRDPGSLIRDADTRQLTFRPGSNDDPGLFRRGVDRVIQNICPHLAQSRAAGLDGRHLRRETLFDDDLLIAEFVGEDGKSALYAVVHIDFALAILVVVGILLHGDNQVGDAGDALFDRSHQLHARNQRHQPVERVGKKLRRKRRMGAFNIFARPAHGHEDRGHLPGILDPNALQPAEEFVFSISLVQRAHGGWLLELEDLFLQIAQAVLLFGGKRRPREAQADLLQAGKIFAQLRGGAPRRGPRIVELVHQPSRKGSERDELFAVQCK